MQGPERRSVCVVSWLLLVAVSQFVSNCMQRRKKKKIRYADSEDETCPKELLPDQQEIV